MDFDPFKIISLIIFLYLIITLNTSQHLSLPRKGCNVPFLGVPIILSQWHTSRRIVSIPPKSTWIPSKSPFIATEIPSITAPIIVLSISLWSRIQSNISAVKFPSIQLIVCFLGSLNIIKLNITETARLNYEKNTFPVSLSVTTLADWTFPAAEKNSFIDSAVDW